MRMKAIDHFFLVWGTEKDRQTDDDMSADAIFLGLDWELLVKMFRGLAPSGHFAHNTLEMLIQCQLFCGVGMAISNGSAHCCTCTGEPTSITMHMRKSGGQRELLVLSSHHCSEHHCMSNVFIC